MLRKNFKRLVKVYFLIKEKIEFIFFVILGKFSRSYEEIKNLVENFNFIFYVYFFFYVDVEYMLYIYNGVLFFVYLLLYEGFGFLLFEVMVCKVLIIVSNIICLFEVLKDVVLYVDFYFEEDIV